MHLDKPGITLADFVSRYENQCDIDHEGAANVGSKRIVLQVESQIERLLVENANSAGHRVCQANVCSKGKKVTPSNGAGRTFCLKR